MTTNPLSRGDAAWLAGYLLMAATSLAAVSIAPPRSGAMLLVPIAGDGHAVAGAIVRGAAIMGPGPGGTIVVRGKRARLFWPMLRAGVLTLAAPAILCGDATS